MRVSLLIGSLLAFLSGGSRGGAASIAIALPLPTTTEMTPLAEEPPPPMPAPVAPEAATAPASPATRYTAMTRDACLAELGTRGVEYVSVDRPELDAPVRIVGSVSGVRIRTLRPPQERSSTPYAIFDCRLVLAIDDFAKILVRHNIIDIMYFSAFRPQVPGGAKRGHENALAIDIAYFGRADGSAYSIVRDFTPIAKERPCESRIRAAGPRELRDIVCEAAAQGIFHVALTPDYDIAHRDHFHLELVPGEVTSYAR